MNKPTETECAQRLLDHIEQQKQHPFSDDYMDGFSVGELAFGFAVICVVILLGIFVDWWLSGKISFAA